MTDAITREEKLMEAMATGSPSNIKPITREEMFLAKAGGQDVQTPEPITRREKLLQGIIDNGGGGGSKPEGTIQITENGTHDVTEYASAEVMVSGGGSTGGGGGTATVVPRNDVTFVDYDGTVLYSYTLAEAKKMTELPPLPSREGLICQGWNYDLETIKSYDRPVDIGATYITDDGKTRIYIHLEEGRTSPMLGVCPNGTVTVDWGDGTEPDILTGTSTSAVKWTPNHEYAKAGDYVITLTVDGSMGFYGSSSTNQNSGILRYSSSSDIRNLTYVSRVLGVEIGIGVTSIGSYAFYKCHSLASIVIPEGVTSIRHSVFKQCYCLTGLVIPESVTSIGNELVSSCYSLESLVIPESVTSIGGNLVSYCHSLESLVIPESVTSIGGYGFSGCYSLESLVIPEGVTSIESALAMSCYSLASIVIPEGVTSIGSSAFNNSHGIRYFDFTACTSVPVLSNINAFSGIAPDCEFRVPSSLYDEWIIATNWATYADKIVARG